MLQFFEARRLHYEIHALVEGRWRLDEILAGELQPGQGAMDRAGFEALEQAAIARATAMLADRTIAAVKVVRERRRNDGFTTSREIFLKEAPPFPKEAPLLTGRLAAALPVAPAVCDDIADLYRRPACRVISIVLRSFLDRLVITPLELLHCAPYLRKLEDNWGMVSAATNQIAQLQAASGDNEVAARRDKIAQLFDRAVAKARDAQGLRRLPVYDGEFQAWADRIGAATAERDRGYYFHVALARHLMGSASYGRRLDFALGGFEQPLSIALAAELDGFVAGCLESPVLVMDLLGHQLNLAQALLALGALAGGQLGGQPPDALGTRVNAQIRRGALPQCIPVLWERIHRELVRLKPLSRNDERREWDALMRLRDELPVLAPDEWREPIEAALRERVRQRRNAAV
jgi:hypothetical protein